jgi:two-component system OmpR family response regulator
MKRILVVDDEPTLVATLRYNLEREGYQVVAASDGDSGLSLARSDRPDLVILDLMLPVIDGFEVCRLLRREMTVPILMLTAKADEVDKVVGLELGADDYVTKPFSIASFWPVCALFSVVPKRRRPSTWNSWQRATFK